MRVTKKSLIALSFVTVLMLSGCGSDSKSDTTKVTEEKVETGVFTDAPVDGLRYMSATQSGYTENGGKFSYKSGEMVQFYLGEVLLGESVGQEVITPIDIVTGATDTSNVRVQNILRLLQTCDSDGNPENGIKLYENTKMLNFANPINLESEADIQTIISNVDTSLVLVDSTTAVGHFQKQQGMMSGDQTQAQIHTPTPTPVPTNDDALGATQTTVNGQITDAVTATPTPPTIPTPTVTSTPTPMPSATPVPTPADVTATLKFDRETGELTNLGDTEVTITNLIVDFSGTYTIQGMTIPFSGTYDYEKATITTTANGTTTSVPMTEEMKNLYPMTVNAGEVMPAGIEEYQVPISGGTGEVNITYTFVTTSGNLVETASITIE